MSIKNVKPNRKGSYIQGYFDVSESKKYIGPQPVIFRSSWERKFCYYCERTDKIIKWSSEPFAIKYYNVLDKKNHTYYPDYYVMIRRADGTVDECIVEVKPKAQLKKPTPPKRKTAKKIKAYQYAARAYITNTCKIDALKKYAAGRKYKVILLTEDSWII